MYVLHIIIQLLQ